MNEEGPSFILAGNAPYENRGCEAIVRGTVKILRKHFNDPRFICVSRFSSDEQFNRQRAVERDGAITHLQTCGRMSREQALRNFWRPYTWSYVHKRYFRPEMLKYLEYQKMILTSTERRRSSPSAGTTTPSTMGFPPYSPTSMTSPSKRGGPSSSGGFCRPLR